MVRTTCISMTDVYSRHYISQFFLVQFVPIHLNTRYLTRAYLQVFLKKIVWKQRQRSFGLKPRKSQRNFWSLSTKNNEFFFLIHTYPDTLPISDLHWTWENYKSHQNRQRFLWLYNTKTGNLTRIASHQKSLSARAALQNMRGQRVTVQCYPPSGCSAKSTFIELYTGRSLNFFVGYVTSHLITGPLRN